MRGDPGGGAARGARSRAERHVPGSLPRHAVRPLAGHVPRDGEQPGHDPRPALRPPRDHRGARATRAPRRSAIAQRVPRPEAALRARPHRRAPRVRRTSGIDDDRRAATRARPACAGSSARLAAVCRARRRCASPRARTCTSQCTAEFVEMVLGPPQVHARARRAHELARRRDGPRVDAVAAATSSSSRRPRCPARARSSSPAT